MSVKQPTIMNDNQTSTGAHNRVMVVLCRFYHSNEYVETEYLQVVPNISVPLTRNQK